MASILEVAARNELLKNAGHHAAREFFGNLEGVLIGDRPADESAVLPPLRAGPPSSGVPVRRGFPNQRPSSPQSLAEARKGSLPGRPSRQRERRGPRTKLLPRAPPSLP